MKKILFILISKSMSQLISNCLSSNDFALTFDDGPTEYTNNILDILYKKNVKSTFFINGLKVIRDQNTINIIHRMYNEGHSIGSHTFSHASLTKLNDFNIQRELYDNEMVFRAILKKRPLLFRPPYFDYDARVLSITNQFGYLVIITSLDSEDWLSENKTLIYNSFINAISLSNTGFISLQHDTIIQSVQILENIIDLLRNNSYNLVNMNECLNLSETLQNDNTYSPFLENGIQFSIFN